MDKDKRDTVPQRRAEMWKEVLLYDELGKGPKTKDAQGEINWEDEKWGQTLNRLSIYLIDKDNQRRLVKQLFLGDRAKGWTKEKYLSEARQVCREISNYNGQSADLERLGRHLHAILAQQTGKDRTKEELARDFGNAGQLEPDPIQPDKAYLVTDHHGKKQWLPKIFVPEAFDWPMDKILADPDPSEGRPFKADDCVRLMTDKYTSHGMPKGIEGYVSGVVSNQFLGWEGNFCQVMFIVACKYETAEQDEITVWDDFLEMKEDQLQLCNKNYPPSLWFPYQVTRSGQVIRDPKSGYFEYHTEVKSYTHPELWAVLTAQPRQSRESLQEQGKENPPPSLGVERPSFQTREKPFEKGWNRIKSLWKTGKKGVRTANQNISKKLKQIIR